jgi:hypothetical protein
MVPLTLRAASIPAGAWTVGAVGGVRAGWCRVWHLEAKCSGVAGQWNMVHVKAFAPQREQQRVGNGLFVFQQQDAVCHGSGWGC